MGRRRKTPGNLDRHDHRPGTTGLLAAAAACSAGLRRSGMRSGRVMCMSPLSRPMYISHSASGISLRLAA
jgi:hypothetical protein